MIIDTKSNGYIIDFHCNHCGKNFKVIWDKGAKSPKYKTCLYCKVPYGATVMYQAGKSEVVIE